MGVQEMWPALAVLARLGPDVEHDVREVVCETFLEKLARLHLPEEGGGRSKFPGDCLIKKG